MNNYILVMDPIYGPHLEHKTHKYIKRWWENGKWHYTYKNTGKTDSDRYLDIYNKFRNQDYYSSYHKIYNLKKEQASLDDKNRKLAGENSRLQEESNKVKEKMIIKKGTNQDIAIVNNRRTIDSNNKKIDTKQKKIDEVNTSINQQKEKNKYNGKAAMTARYMYHQDQAQIASDARKRKGSYIIKKAYNVAVSTKSIKKGIETLANLFKKRDRIDYNDYLKKVDNTISIANAQNKLNSMAKRNKKNYKKEDKGKR